MNININMEDIHYNKYIKYKTKYLELKELNGGGLLKKFRGLFKSSAPNTPVASVASVAPAEPTGPRRPDILGHNGQLFHDLQNNYRIYLRKLMWMKYDSTLSEKKLNDYAREKDDGFAIPSYYDPDNYISIFKQSLRIDIMQVDDLLYSIMENDTTNNNIGTIIYSKNEAKIKFIIGLINKIINDINIIINNISTIHLEKLKIKYPTLIKKGIFEHSYMYDIIFKNVIYKLNAWLTYFDSIKK